MKYPIKAIILVLLTGLTAFFIHREEQRDTFDSRICTVEPDGNLNWDAENPPKDGKPVSLNGVYLEWLAGNASELISDPEVSLLRVDMDKMQEVGDFGPRMQWALVLKELLANKQKTEPDGKLKAVGLVPALSWNEENPFEQGGLFMVMKDMPKLVLGSVFGSGSSAGKPTASDYAVIQSASGDIGQIPQVLEVVGRPDLELAHVEAVQRTGDGTILIPEETERKFNGQVAFTHIELQEEFESGPDGIRVALLARVEDKLVASFPLQMILNHRNMTVDDVSVTMGPRPKIQVGTEYTIPVDEKGRMTVYHGVQGGFPEMQAQLMALMVSEFSEVELVGNLPDRIAKVEAEIEELNMLIEMGEVEAAEAAVKAAVEGESGPDPARPELDSEVEVEPTALEQAKTRLLGAQRELKSLKEEEAGKRMSVEEILESFKQNAIVIGYDQEREKQFSLPQGEKVSRTELLSMAIATIQSGKHITTWQPVARYGSWGVLVFLGLVLVRWRRTRIVIGGLGLALLAVLVVPMLVFQTSLSWTPPWISLAICFVIVLVGLVLPRTSPKKVAEPEAATEEATAS